MRLDKFISNMGIMSRKECQRAAKCGDITVNGKIIKDTSAHIDENCDEICVCGKKITYEKHIYIIMNKPEGYVSVTQDEKDLTVLDLLDDTVNKKDLFPCGRLDKFTTGLVFLTSDGDLAHRLLSKKNHAAKRYYFECKFPLSDDDIEKLKAGIELDDGYITLPCDVERENEKSGYITLFEGKYHQIKRMMEGVNNKICALHRLSFANLTLDGVDQGKWRYLEKDELEELISISNKLK